MINKESERRETEVSENEIANRFENAGWKVREENVSGRADVVADSGKFSIRPDEKLLGHETVFEILDKDADMKVYAHEVPTPERAAALVNRYGGPSEFSAITPGKVPMAPPGTES